jgi:hypothetical protein
MANRRQFLGTLGRIVGGGLLLPVAGKGALSFADAAKAAELPVAVSPLPFSAECLALRSLKRDMLATRLAGDRNDERGATVRAEHYLRYLSLSDAIAARPPTWTNAVELAEIAWHWAPKRQLRDLGDDGPSPWTTTLRDAGNPTRGGASAALIEAVLTLGGGERFDHEVELWLMPNSGGRAHV